MRFFISKIFYNGRWCDTIIKNTFKGCAGLLRIADWIDGYEGPSDIEFYDLKGKIITPGYIDMHVHLTDGGCEELITLATTARRAGLLSGTPGLVTMHMGNGKGKLDSIFYVLNHPDVPAPPICSERQN